MCVCACVFLCHAFLGTTRIHAYMHVHIHNVDVVQASKSLRASDPVSHARRIFKRLDVNNSGSLEAEELQQAVYRIEDEMTAACEGGVRLECDEPGILRPAPADDADGGGADGEGCRSSMAGGASVPALALFLLGGLALRRRS